MRARTQVATRRSECGAILVMVAISLLVLTGFLAFVIDNGMILMARRQAQNAADAGALAGAVARSFDEVADPPASGGTAYLSAVSAAQANGVFGQTPGVEVLWECPPWMTGVSATACVRVNTYRDGTNSSVVLPSYFANLFGVSSHKVRATATARVAAGNSIRCLLPFAVIDRWQDNYDENVDTTYFSTDGDTGTAGWTPNDRYQPGDGDVYIGPYGGNTSHTGWRTTIDYGRQLVLKDGSPGNYSTGWANTVLLPGSTGYDDVGDDIRECNEQPVGIATAANACTVSDYPNGCMDVQTGVGQGPIKLNVDDLVDQDSGAAWDADASGLNGPGSGAVVGGGGMSSPRIRPIAIIDINHYDASGCTGGTCVAKVANIIGFFLEGMCQDVSLDDGLICDDPTKDVVGRIVTLPSKYIAGVGNVDPTASFLKIITLVR